jgi:hypothetical protein
MSDLIPKKTLHLSLKSDAEHIRAYLNGEYSDLDVSLSKDLSDKLIRIECCKELISDCYPKHMILTTLSNQFGISLGQSRNIYLLTTEVYDEKTLHKERSLYELQQALEIAKLQMDTKQITVIVKAKDKILNEHFGVGIESALKNVTLPKIIISETLTSLPIYAEGSAENLLEEGKKLLDYAQQLRNEYSKDPDNSTISIELSP